MHHLSERLATEISRLRDLATACHLQSMGHANQVGDTHRKNMIVFRTVADALTEAAIALERAQAEIAA